MGQEPSGVAFNAFTLNSQKKPHNPLINSGAIMTSSMFSPELILPKRFKKLTQDFSHLGIILFIYYFILFCSLIYFSYGNFFVQLEAKK